MKALWVGAVETAKHWTSRDRVAGSSSDESRGRSPQEHDSVGHGRHNSISGKRKRHLQYGKNGEPQSRQSRTLGVSGGLGEGLGVGQSPHWLPASAATGPYLSTMNAIGSINNDVPSTDGASPALPFPSNSYQAPSEPAEPASIARTKSHHHSRGKAHDYLAEQIQQKEEYIRTLEQKMMRYTDTREQEITRIREEKDNLELTLQEEMKRRKVEERKLHDTIKHLQDELSKCQTQIMGQNTHQMNLENERNSIENEYRKLQETFKVEKGRSMKLTNDLARLSNLNPESKRDDQYFCSMLNSIFMSIQDWVRNNINDADIGDEVIASLSVSAKTRLERLCGSHWEWLLKTECAMVIQALINDEIRINLMIPFLCGVEESESFMTIIKLISGTSEEIIRWKMSTVDMLSRNEVFLQKIRARSQQLAEFIVELISPLAISRKGKGLKKLQNMIEKAALGGLECQKEPSHFVFTRFECGDLWHAGRMCEAEGQCTIGSLGKEAVPIVALTISPLITRESHEEGWAPVPILLAKVFVVPDIKHVDSQTTIQEISTENPNQVIQQSSDDDGSDNHSQCTMVNQRGEAGVASEVETSSDMTVAQTECAASLPSTTESLPLEIQMNSQQYELPLPSEHETDFHLLGSLQLSELLISNGEIDVKRDTASPRCVEGVLIELGQSYDQGESASVVVNEAVIGKNAILESSQSPYLALEHVNPDLRYLDFKIAEPLAGIEAGVRTGPVDPELAESSPPGVQQALAGAKNALSEEDTDVSMIDAHHGDIGSDTEMEHGEHLTPHGNNSV